MSRMQSASASRQRQHGVAAVEFAILAVVLVVLLGAPLFIGRVMWHYTVIQKAARDGARYLATVPEAEMRTQTMAPQAAAVASLIVAAELADLNTGAQPPLVTVQCNGKNCGGVTAWSTVSVFIETEMHDPFFGAGYGGGDGVAISAEVKMNYIGTK